MNNETGTTLGFIPLMVSWYLNLLTIVSPSIVPIILSSIASAMAIINYYYQIKKNKKS